MATKKATTTKKSASKKSTAAKKAATAVKTAPKKTTKKPSGSVRNFFDSDLTIVKLVTGNPRREGTFGHESFGLIKNGMTVAQFTAKGGRLRDLHWDIDHKYVQLKKA